MLSLGFCLPSSHVKKWLFSNTQLPIIAELILSADNVRDEKMLRSEGKLFPRCGRKSQANIKRATFVVNSTIKSELNSRSANAFEGKNFKTLV